MTSLDQEIEIEAPIEYVFGWRTTPENWLRSTPGLIDYEVIDETDEGTLHRLRFNMLGKTITSDELFTVDAENYRTLSVIDDETMTAEMVFDYTETDSGTNLHVHGDFETGGSLFQRALQPVFKRYMKRQIRNTMTTMKDVIEAEYAVEEHEPVEA
jgi:carbon monoxide dehydrogenase subunit G